jgi:hypothetical protein
MFPINQIQNIMNFAINSVIEKKIKKNM